MSLQPVMHNFTIWRGGTWRYPFDWLIQEGKMTEPEDLTGFRGTLTIVPSGETEPWATYSEELSETGSGIIFGGESGRIDLIISSEDTASITWKQAKFELSVVNNANERIPLIVGVFTARGPL